MNPDDFELESGTGDDSTSLDALVDELDVDADDSAETDEGDTGFEWVEDELADADRDSLAALRDVDHVLVRSPLRGDGADELCVDLATTAAPAQPSVLSISLTRAGDDLLGIWDAHAAVQPANLALVRVGGQSGPSSAVAVGLESGTPTELTVTSVADPSDLPRLGVKTANVLAEWGEAGRQPVVCVHSITTLLQYVDTERLFRFLHLLQSRIDSVDGTGHYHIDPRSHPPETVSIFESLFDAVVELSPDGDVDVSVD